MGKLDFLLSEMNGCKRLRSTGREKWICEGIILRQHDPVDNPVSHFTTASRTTEGGAPEDISPDPRSSSFPFPVIKHGAGRRTVPLSFPASLPLSLSIWDPIYIHYRRTFSRHVARPPEEDGDAAIAALRKRSSIVRLIAVVFVGGAAQKMGCLWGMRHGVDGAAARPWQYSARPSHWCWLVVGEVCEATDNTKVGFILPGRILRRKGATIIY